MEAKLQQQTSQKAQTNKPNLTGIPTQMKLDFERQSGLSFDDVRVHYNSDKPAQLQALAYTQGTQVYVGPGQERHLKHELGHVVQQKQGRVKTNGLIKNIPVNVEASLEHEADTYPPKTSAVVQQCYLGGGNAPIQCRLHFKYINDSEDNGLWTAIETGRPSFSNECDTRFKIPAKDNKSRNHIIPYKAINRILSETIVQNLNLNKKRPKNESINKINSKMSRTEFILRQLVTMVIPKETDFMYSEIKLTKAEEKKKQTINDVLKGVKPYRDAAKILVAKIMNCLTLNLDIDGLQLDALTNELEFYLNNSYANLRISHKDVNLSIGGHIDPRANTYAQEKGSPHRISFSSSAESPLDYPTSVSNPKKVFHSLNYSMAKRMSLYHIINYGLSLSKSPDDINLPGFYVAMQKKTDSSENPTSYDVFSSDIDFPKEEAKSTPKESTEDGDTADLPKKAESRKSKEAKITIKPVLGKKFTVSAMQWNALSKRIKKAKDDKRSQSSGPYIYDVFGGHDSALRDGDSALDDLDSFLKDLGVSFAKESESATPMEIDFEEAQSATPMEIDFEEAQSEPRKRDRTDSDEEYHPKRGATS